MGIIKMESTSDQVYQDMDLLEKTFNSAVGVKESPFVLHGKIKECDAKVVAGCQKAEAQLKDHAWHGSFTFTANNVTSGEEVYSKVFE